MTTRIILLLLLFSVMGEAAFSQASKKKAVSSNRATPSAAEMPSKSEMLSKMNDATTEVKKQLADLEQQLKTTENPEEKKSLQEQITVLKKQVTMMQGLNKNLSGLSEKVYKEAAEEETAPTVPKRDLTRISILPKKTLTEAELLLFIKNVHAGVEKLIPAAERAEALNIYNETKAKYKSTVIVASAASGCWMLGHWEKALFIIGKACVDDITDADNLNNYAAFLIMTGGEQAALPILEYLNEQYPNNSTILNNIGQAWFGLGDTDNARKYLNNATELYPNHSTANSTLSEISLANNDPAAAISQLKASLKETYDPEKEAELRKLGYEIKFADMPPLNYPMKNDPFGLIPIIKSWNPDKIQGSIADVQTAVALQSYVGGVEKFDKDLQNEDAELDKQLQDRGNRLGKDSGFRREFLDPYNCPAYLLAARSLQLYCFENSGLCFKPLERASPLIAGLWLPLKKPNPGMDEMLSISEIVKDCEDVWFTEVLQPIAVLTKSMHESTQTDNCEDYDRKIDAYLAKRKEIYAQGVKTIQKEFINNSQKLTNYIKYKLYSSLDDPPKDINDLSADLIADITFRIERRRKRNNDYDLVLSLIEKSAEFQDKYRSSCQDRFSSPDPERGVVDDLAPLKVKEVECEYIKHVTTGDLYEFKLQCNTITEKINSKTKKRKPDVPKGSGHNSPRRNSSRGPIQGRGPKMPQGEIDNIQQATSKGPLTAENKDISQFSLEYNKWGNLVGFNFQLSEDGSTLKDPDSAESGIDSRWSWNAIASPKKGHLNKLLLK